MTREQRDLLLCPLCGKLALLERFLKSERMEGFNLTVRTCHFQGGGRAGRPKVVLTDDQGRVRLNSSGKPMLRLELDEDGKPLPGPGFAWTRRDLTVDERDKIVGAAHTVTSRLVADFITDVVGTANEHDFEALCARFHEDAETEYETRARLLENIRELRSQR